MPGRTESAKPRLSWAKYSILFFGGPHEAFRMHTWGPRPMHSKPPEVEASARKVHWILLILGLGFFSSKNFPFAASIWSSQLQLSDILAPRSEHSQKGLRFLGVWHSGEIPGLGFVYTAEAEENSWQESVACCHVPLAPQGPIST